MMRDELLERIAALPADADVGVQIGDDHLDITDVIPWGAGRFGALTCHPNDVRDLLRAWRLHVRPGEAEPKLARMRT